PEPKKPEPKVEAKKPEPKVEAKKAEPKKPEPKVEAKKTEPGAPTKPAKPGQKPVDLAALRLGAVEPEELAEIAEEAETDEAEEAVEAEVAIEVAAEEAEAVEVEAPKKKEEPKPRVMSQAEIDLLNENLGELPWGYGDDAVTLAARDPHTLWVYWDFAEQTVQRVRSGLKNPRAVLRLYDAGQLVREVDIALEARSWYLSHITPGRKYRAEIHFVGERGKHQRLGQTSNPIGAPGEGPSPVIDDRFVTLPWEVPIVRSTALLEKPHDGGPFADAGRDALMALAESGLHHEELVDGAPGRVEVTVEVVRGLGGSESLVERRRRIAGEGGRVNVRSSGQWTSSRQG
ncbi:MAG: DUF4912 domain-containing protein, partial [Deltaproteobacteria bacterium]|nr:DUF4912 domain-containing protein [Deltaproteobacteria bacterium]